jgi:hypothetical protein
MWPESAASSSGRRYIRGVGGLSAYWGQAPSPAAPVPPLLAIMFGVLLLVTYVRPQASASEQIEKIAVNLARLDGAEQIEEMNVPGFRLHRLTGKLRGF